MIGLGACWTSSWSLETLRIEDKEEHLKHQNVEEVQKRKKTKTPIQTWRAKCTRFPSFYNGRAPQNFVIPLPLPTFYLLPCHITTNIGKCWKGSMLPKNIYEYFLFMYIFAWMNGWMCLHVYECVHEFVYKCANVYNVCMYDWKSYMTIVWKCVWMDGLNVCVYFYGWMCINDCMNACSNGHGLGSNRTEPLKSLVYRFMGSKMDN